MTKPVPPFIAWAHHMNEPGAPELTDLEWAFLNYDPGFWLREHQIPPSADWRYFGFIGGRGLGKTFAIGGHIVQEVMVGNYRDIALLAQDETRAYSLQVNALLEASPPWFPAQTLGNTVYWPNGARATVYSPEAPSKVRGFSGDCVWLSELVGWPHTTRLEAFNNVITATRMGAARVLFDTTSKGRNEIIEYLMALNEEDPVRYCIARGTIFDNPLFSRQYLAEQCRLYSGRRYDEELLGKVFTESQGALWELAWIDEHRRAVPPTQVDVTIVGLDPAITVREGSDDTGIIVASRATDGEFYVSRDRTGRHTPEQYATIVVDEHLEGASGAVVETNRGGMTVTSTIRAIGRERGIDVRVLKPGQKFPRRSPGIIYVREVHSRGNKHSRGGGPAALYKSGRVHHVGVLTDLELEQTTYEPGTAESPNRYDACNLVLTELAELESNKPTARQQKERIGQEVNASGELRRKLMSLGKNRSVT